MYSITTCIYGIKLTDEIYDIFESKNLEPEDHFQTLYHGNMDNAPGFLGVILDSWDECENVIVSNLKLIPTDEQIEEVKNMIKDLPDEIRDSINSEIVDTHLIFSTS